MATEICVNFGSGNGLLPDGTKPLPEPMLTDHQWSPATFALGQFHKRCLNHQSLKFVWKLHWKISFKLDRGQWDTSYSKIGMVVNNGLVHIKQQGICIHHDDINQFANTSTAPELLIEPCWFYILICASDYMLIFCLYFRWASISLASTDNYNWD